MTCRIAMIRSEMFLPFSNFQILKFALYTRFQLAKKYLHYYLTASNGKGHGIHSPFVYDFTRNVLNDRRHFYAYEHIESLRERLATDNTLLDIEDYGAGSITGSSKQRSISSITRSAAKSKKLSRLLFRMVNHYQPRSIIELGTSLGLSSAYMASAAPRAKLITIEGSPSLTSAARENHRVLQLANVQVINGKFDELLPGILNSLEKVDLAFIDGNHRFEPTKFYFDQFLKKSTENSILIFDDIHWSREMEDVWQIIKLHPLVTASIDLFFIGIVLFKEVFKSKQQFTIRF